MKNKISTISIFLTVSLLAFCVFPARAQEELGFCDLADQNPDSAYKLTQIRFRDALENDDKRMQTLYLMDFTRIDMLQNSLDSAIHRQNRALSIAENTGDTGFIAVTYLRFGSLYADLEIHYKAMDFLKKAVSLAQTVNDSQVISVAAFNYSLVLSEEEQYKEAIEQSEKSLLYGGNSIPEYDLLISYSELAANLFNVGRTDEGKLYLQKADSITTLLDSAMYYPLFFCYAANYDTLAKDFQSAVKNSTAALKLCKTTNNRRGEVYATIQLSKIFAQTGNFDRALELAKNANDLVVEHNLGVFHEYKMFKNLSVAHSLKGEFKKAQQYLDQAQKALKKLRTSGKSKAAMMADLEQSEKRNTLLAKEKILLAKEQEVKSVEAGYRKRQLILISSVTVLLLASSIFLFCLYLKNRRLLELKRNIISAAGHDIKSPVAQLESTLDIMTMDIDDKETLQTLLPGVRQNLKKASGSIDAILNWARDSMLKEKAPVERVSAAEVIDACLPYVSHDIQQKHIQVIKDVNPEHKIMVNKDQLSIVVRNLLSNAVKFNPVGGALKIETVKEKKRVYISISDKGPGIPKNIQKDLFRIPLKSSGSGRLKGGHGLGLYLSNIFAKKGSGKLKFKTTPGKGTTFTVYFPAA